MRMRNRLILTAAIVLVFAASLLAKRLLGQSNTAPADRPGSCRRIISTAPSITETLFALGMGDRVVGVTRFCNYPAEARDRARVGGTLDPNFEAVVALRPDLVVTLIENQYARRALGKLRIATLPVDHRNIEGILESIPAMGRPCGVEQAGEQLTAELRCRMQAVRRNTAPLPRPSVLVAVDRTLGCGRLEDVYIAGRDGHLDRLVELAGGRNAYRQGAVRFPVVSTEGILRLNPEVIIDIVPERQAAKLGKDTIAADWRQVAEVDAVRNGHVYVLADDRASIPGPGFIRLVERIARLIHPHVEWPENF